MTNFLRRHFPVVMLIFLTACAAPPVAKESIGGGELPGKKHLLVAAQIGNDHGKKIVTVVLDEARRVAKRYDVLSIDQMVENSVHVVYSGPASKYAVDEFVASVSEKKSSIRALAASLKRVSEYGQQLAHGDRLVAIVVSPGTSDPAAIKEFTQIAATIPPSVLLFVVTSPENRLSFSRSLSPIRDRVVMVGQGMSDVKAISDRL